MNNFHAYERATGLNSLFMNASIKISCILLKEEEGCQLKAEIYIVHGTTSFKCFIEWWCAMCLIQCYFSLVYIDV